MGERYYLTGCQLGMIKMFVKNDAVSIRENIEKILDDIEKKQFIGNKHDLENCLTKEAK